LSKNNPYKSQFSPKLTSKILKFFTEARASARACWAIAPPLLRRQLEIKIDDYIL
jgi:hypothetical protein